MKIENLVRISLDQATETGVCVMINDKIVIAEVWKLDNVPKADIRMEYVILSVNKRLEKLLDLYRGFPIFVTIEDIFDGLNRKTYKDLARLQGSLILTLMSRKILFDIITPRRWKAKYGIKGGVEGKKKSMEIASLILGREVTDDNMADAICMGDYGKKYIKIN
jgi:Holliday junction resolvasome RuvABC endonuclease subunit